MSTSREGANIWWILFQRHYKRSLRDRVQSLKRAIKSSYFWHDSFGHFYFKWFHCPILGHEWQNVKDPGNEPDDWYCFKCQQRDKLKALEDK